MTKKPEYGLLNALSTCAAKAGFDSRIAGQYSPDRLLLESVQYYFDERARKAGLLFLRPGLDARVFIGAMVVEEGFEKYIKWRQSVIDKIATMSTSVEMKAA